ncbi:MAG: cytochrome c oxidase subunit 3 family protein [Nitrospiraceae bacterium]|nr:MAG: cytochrome c oxidase subunit 3 family protein [Nitrospiraceae bacterium]
MNTSGGEITVHDKHVDYSGAKMGMWLFLFTELIFFGGMFLLYAVYRSSFPEEFYSTSAELHRTIGAVNTVVLITSSLTMACSITAVKKGDTRLSALFQLLTILFALTFLVVKYFEWEAKIGHGIYPGSEALTAQGQGKIIFYSLYFVMTGIHGVHVLAGIAVISVTMAMTLKNRINKGDYIRLENTGLYWHFVDIIWVYLFPLLYLIG